MKKKFLFILFRLSIAAVLLLAGCTHYYDVDFPEHEEEELIPAEGAACSFVVRAERWETRTTVEECFKLFEYRVIIGGEVVESRLVDLAYFDENITSVYVPGDPALYFEIGFDVSANESPDRRTVVVETLTAKNFWRYEDHVDAGDDTWKAVWEAVQEGAI